MTEPVTLTGPSSPAAERAAPRSVVGTWDRQTELIIACVLAMAVIAYWDGLTDLASLRGPSMAVFAASVGFAVQGYRRTGDLLNPLTVLSALFAIRIGLPSLMLVYSEIPRSLFFQQFRLSETSLVRGQVHGGLSVLTVLLGWYACPPQAGAAMRAMFTKLRGFPPQDSSLVPSAVLAFAVGALAALVYLIVNFGDPIAAATSGITRGSTAEGTSRYSFAAVGLLVTSSVLLTLYLSHQDRRPLLVYAPVLTACTILTIFGGRVGALGPLALGYVGVHYLRRPRGDRRSTGRRLAFATVLGVLLLGYAGFVVNYRGGEGVSAAGNSFSAQGVRDYAEDSVWGELGTLHQYALGERLGAGALDGRTYPEIIGPLVAFTSFEVKRPGRAMVERFGPRGFGTDWAFHSGLYVDVYTNTGLWAAVLACILFGMLLRAEYSGFMSGSKTLGGVFMHCLFLWTMIWIFFESIAVALSQFQVAVPVLGMIYVGSRLLSARPAAV